MVCLMNKINEEAMNGSPLSTTPVQDLSNSPTATSSPPPRMLFT